MAGWLDRLRDAVKADGRSLRDVSLSAGLGPNYLSELLGKDKEPGINKLERLCRELNVSLAYVLTGLQVTPEDEEKLALLAELPEEDAATVLHFARRLRDAQK